MLHLTEADEENHPCATIRKPAFLAILAALQFFVWKGERGMATSRSSIL